MERLEKELGYNLKDEVQAQKDYKKFGKHLKKVGMKKEARTVKGIQKQEAGHAKKLKKIHSKLEKMEK